VATISDVAARAGVSTATVSRALNGKSTGDRDLVARVVAAAGELGYQPNGPARNALSARNHICALFDQVTPQQLACASTGASALIAGSNDSATTIAVRPLVAEAAPDNAVR
jgi:DNA-binding LacI/PurR family transcriptional regulator